MSEYHYATVFTAYNTRVAICACASTLTKSDNMHSAVAAIVHLNKICNAIHEWDVTAKTYHENSWLEIKGK